MPSVRAVGASFGRLGRPAIARVLSASEELPMDIVAQGRGESLGAVRNGWNRPRQFVVALEESPTQYDFPQRCPIGRASGLLTSDRRKKTYWVGLDRARELARKCNVCNGFRNRKWHIRDI